MSASVELQENGHVIDEDVESRRHVRQALALAPAERLRALTGAYQLFVMGQRRLGRPIFGEES